MSQGTFLDTLIRLEAFKRIFVIRPKLDFFQKGKSMIFGQNWPIFEVGIFYLFMSLGISASRKTQMEIIFKWKNALTKNFLFNSHPDFIFCGLFFCPWEPFRTHWFDWKLLRPRPHVSGYFWIRKFFFPDTASVHTHPANSAANPDIFESALQSGKK